MGALSAGGGRGAVANFPPEEGEEDEEAKLEGGKLGNFPPLLPCSPSALQGIMCVKVQAKFYPANERLKNICVTFQNELKNEA